MPTSSVPLHAAARWWALLIKAGVDPPHGGLEVTGPGPVAQAQAACRGAARRFAARPCPPKTRNAVIEALSSYGLAVVTDSVLVVEDDASFADLLVDVLDRRGFAVASVSTGADALAHATREEVDVVLLDLALPDVDGVDLCGQLRKAGFDGGIIMVTARTAELDRVVGLDAGADDYVCKPVGLTELVARVEAVLRRVRRSDGGRIVTPTGLVIDPAVRSATYGRAATVLGPREVVLLVMLARFHGQLVTRQELIDGVWGGHRPSDQGMSAAFARLRAKLDAIGAPDKVVVVRGHGCRLALPHDA